MELHLVLPTMTGLQHIKLLETQSVGVKSICDLRPSPLPLASEVGPKRARKSGDRCYYRKSSGTPTRFLIRLPSDQGHDKL
jgi:hypothetical protein